VLLVLLRMEVALVLLLRVWLVIRGKSLVLLTHIHGQVINRRRSMLKG